MAEGSMVTEPRPGRRLARWVWALGLLSLLAASGYLLALWQSDQLPVRVVTVKGTIEHLSPHQLQETVVAHLDGGILTQDLAEIRRAVEALPWIRSASLRRHWPDRLELAVVEQTAVARWGENALIGADGVIFEPAAEDIPPGLPKLSGADRDASKLAQRFLDWKPRLAALALDIETLVLDGRGAWTLRLSPGFSLALGKTQVRERIARFIRVYPELAVGGTPSVVDMRYSNGLAVRWAENGPQASRPDATRGARSAGLESRFPEGLSGELLIALGKP